MRRATIHPAAFRRAVSRWRAGKNSYTAMLAQFGVSRERLTRLLIEAVGRREYLRVSEWYRTACHRLGYERRREISMRVLGATA